MPVSQGVSGEPVSRRALGRRTTGRWRSESQSYCGGRTS